MSKKRVAATNQPFSWTAGFWSMLRWNLLAGGSVAVDGCDAGRGVFV